MDFLTLVTDSGKVDAIVAGKLYLRGRVGIKRRGVTLSTVLARSFVNSAASPVLAFAVRDHALLPLAPRPGSRLPADRPRVIASSVEQKHI
jgi:hypothetical protein